MGYCKGQFIMAPAVVSPFFSTLNLKQKLLRPRQISYLAFKLALEAEGFGKDDLAGLLVKVSCVMSGEERRERRRAIKLSVLGPAS